MSTGLQMMRALGVGQTHDHGHQPGQQKRQHESVLAHRLAGGSHGAAGRGGAPCGCEEQRGGESGDAEEVKATAHRRRGRVPERSSRLGRRCLGEERDAKVAERHISTLVDALRERRSPTRVDGETEMA